MSSDQPTVYGLHSGFLQSAARFPDRPALEAQGQVLSYSELHRKAAAISSVLDARSPTGAPLLCGVLANRSVPVYSGTLGALMSGRAVVPLNPTFPVERTRQMIEQADLQALIVDAKGEAQLDELLADEARAPMLVVLTECDEPERHALRWPRHTFASTKGLDAPEGWLPSSVEPDSLAYLFFTSGSTGIPKGVGVLHRNVTRFVDMSVERYREIGLCETDRFSQFYDITFDSSMFDLHVSWAVGGCLCSPSVADWINPNKFVESRGLTVIDIVPSSGHAMNRTTGWRAGRFTALRLCRFGGEALSADLAAALASAAPNAVVDNVYGPTECTVDAAYYRWDTLRSPAECEHGIVPIGLAGPKVGLLVVDDHLAEVPEGAEGELLISGPQVTPGYWKSPERTALAFVPVPGRTGTFYRTGDLVRRPTPGKPITFLGRLDHQIKISGVRIELGEVEHALREEAGTDMAVALGWPITSSGASGIVGFVASADADMASIRARLKSKLPAVMVPKDIHRVDALPLNVNGKIDRKALLERLKAGIST